jgi:hypothetical protein
MHMPPHQAFFTMQEAQTKAVSAAVEARFFFAMVTGRGLAIIGPPVDSVKLIEKVIAK